MDWVNRRVVFLYSYIGARSVKGGCEVADTLNVSFAAGITVNVTLKATLFFLTDEPANRQSIPETR